MKAEVLSISPKIIRFHEVYSDEEIEKLKEISLRPIPWESGFEIFHEFLKMRGWCLYAWVFDSQNHNMCSSHYGGHLSIDI